MKKKRREAHASRRFFHLFRPFLIETSQQGELFGLKSRLSFLGSRPSSRVRSLGTFRETHMSDISYTWEEYIDLNEKLVAMVAKSGWQFDSILCLSRGGMRPGDFFSRVYDMPLAVLATSSYREAKGTVQSDLDISDCITGVSELKGRVLLVDDMVDSGKTIREVIEHLKKLPRHHRDPRRRPLVQGPLRPRPRLARRIPRGQSLDPPAVRMLRRPRPGQAHRARRSKGSRQEGLRTGRGVTFRELFGS